MFNTKKKSETTAMINTIIGDNSRIEGQLIASESTRVDGTLRGKILSESTVIIGENGVVYGDIDGFEILVAGTVYGNLHAQQKIQLTETGRVVGDLFTKSLVIDEGASFRGRCSMEIAEKAEELSAAGTLPEAEELPKLGTFPEAEELPTAGELSESEPEPGKEEELKEEKKEAV